MRDQTILVYGLGFVFLLCAGCASTQPPASETAQAREEVPAKTVTVTSEVSIAPQPQPAAPPPRQQPTMRVRTDEERESCNVHPEDDGQQMVVSNEKDWFLYASEGAQVECGRYGGNVTIVDGPLSIKVKPLIPSMGSGDDIELLLRKEAIKYIRSELQQKYGSGSNLEFDEVKLGRTKRPALCVESDLTINGSPGKVAACVTSKKNVNDEIVVHRVVWAGPVESYDPKLTYKNVKEAAVGWFRYSDTDGMGKIVYKW